MESPNRIRELREAKGWTQQRLADLAGTTNQQIGRLEKGDRRLTQEWMDRLAQALGCAPGDLLPQADKPVLPEEPDLIQIEAETVAVPEGHVLGHLPSRNQIDLIPVLATARGGLDQEMFLDDGPIDHIPRPRTLEGVVDAYAMAVTGESMFPMYRAGNTLHVNPYMRPTPGTGVVIWKKNNAVLIKEFVRRTADGVLVREYQPKEREFLVPHDAIRAVHAVVGADYT